MKVVMMNHESPEDISYRSGPAGEAYREAWAAYNETVKHKVVGGRAINTNITATTIRNVDGKRVVEDGPFAASKEALGGFFIFEVDSLEEAIELASGNPCIERGAVELVVVAECHPEKC